MLNSSLSDQDRIDLGEVIGYMSRMTGYPTPDFLELNDTAMLRVMICRTRTLAARNGLTKRSA
jgi:hypothetical protein